MTYRGIVRNGKVELQGEPRLAEGTVVKVEPEQSQWRGQWEEFARQVDQEWSGEQSSLDAVSEARQ